MAGRPISGVLLAVVATTAAACILIERYDPPVPDPPDAGGGSGGLASTGSSAGATGGAGGTTGSTGGTTTGSGGATGGTGGTGGSGGSGGATSTSSATGGSGGASSSSSSSASSSSSSSASSSSSSSASSGSGAPGTAVWSKRFGAALDDTASDVAADAAGNVIVVGGFQGSVDFGGGALASAGQNDVFVVKLDSAGGHLWSKQFGDGSSQNANAVAADAVGNVYVAGNFQGGIDFGAPTTPLASAGQTDVYLAKINTAGAPLWAKRYGDAAAQSLATGGIAPFPGGGVVITGSVAGSIDFGDGPIASAGSDDIFVARIDAAGMPVWKHVWGDAAQQRARGIAVASNGDVAITGSMQGSVDFGGGALVAGTSIDAFVVVLDAAGNHQWSKRYGDATSDQIGRSVAFDPAGTVWVTGSFSGSVDLGGGALTAAGASANLFVARLGAGGAHLVSKAWGDGTPPGQQAHRIAADAAGNIILGGDFAGALDFGAGPITSPVAIDAFVAKLSPVLVPVFASDHGDTSGQSIGAVRVDANGNILVAGAFFGSLDFGAGLMTSAGANDAFVAKLLP